MIFVKLFHDGGRYHIETNPLICSANKWAGFYIAASVMKELSSIAEINQAMVFIWCFSLEKWNEVSLDVFSLESSHRF